MTEIDADWIKQRLDPTQRGQKAALARAAGLTPKQLSYILGGERTVKQAEAAAIAAFFGETVALIPEPAARGPGFSETGEGFVTALRKPPADLQATLAARPGRMAYAVNASAVAFGILMGDMIVMEFGQSGDSGGLVIATEATPQGEAHSFIARQAGGVLLLADPASPPKRAQNGNTISIMGRVVAVYRQVSAS